MKIRNIIVELERDGRWVAVTVSLKQGVYMQGVEQIYPMELRLFSDIMELLGAYEDHVVKE